MPMEVEITDLRLNDNGTYLQRVIALKARSENEAWSYISRNATWRCRLHTNEGLLRKEDGSTEGELTARREEDLSEEKKSTELLPYEMTELGRKLLTGE